MVKGLRKGTKGYEYCRQSIGQPNLTVATFESFVVIAGDISPIDVITHVPILCEEANVPYCYVPSKEDLGQAGSTKRPTSCIMVVPGKGDADESYEECFKELKTLDETIISA